MRTTFIAALLLTIALPVAAGQWTTGTYVYDGSGNITSIGPNSDNKTALWGSFGYTPDKDVARAAMKVETLPFSVEELTWSFLDVANDGGRLAVMWDKTMASAPFKIGT